MKKLILLCVVLFASAGMYGQSIYEMKYSFNKLDKDGNETTVPDKEYSAMMFYYSSQDTNTMRVRYLDDLTGQYIIVEQRMVTKLIDKGDKQYWELVGTNPVFVSKVDPKYTYYPDRVVLEKTPGDKYYHPSFVTSADNPAAGTKNHYGKITSFDVLAKENVNNDHLLLYGWRWPDSKQPEQPTEHNNNTFDFATSTLYLIQVTNNLDEKLGTGFYENHLNIKDLFSDAATSCGIGFKSIEIMGNDFNKDNVVSAIANLHTGPNDIIVFYYSGHGYRYDDQVSQWPRMALTNSATTMEELHVNSLSLNDDVYVPLSQKGAHLLLVVGECCNALMGPTPTLRDPVKMSSSYYFPDANSIKTLLKQSGKMLVATSKPAESTWYYVTAGGIFGTNFIDNIAKATSVSSTGGTVSWKEIIENTVQETISKSIANEPNTQEQDPIYDIDIH